MLQPGKKGSIIVQKVAYTVIIIFAYLMGRYVPLYGVDLSAYADRSVNAEELLVQTIGGDIHQYSLFALGISPYITSILIVQMTMACRKLWSKDTVSPAKADKISLALTMIFAAIQSFFRVQELQFRAAGTALIMVKAICISEMMTGVLLILWLSDRNAKYGIGSRTTLIYINILDGILITLKGHGIRELAIPLAISSVVIVIMLMMECTEKRIPVQRISIHNIYADKNYLAIKLNPVGVMPIMFSTAFFMLPQFLAAGLGCLFPKNEQILWWQDNLTLSKPFGMAVYLVIIYLLTIVFSLLFIGPKDIAEQFLKSGDSILNLHAGRDTKKYLTREIYGIGFFSATVMSVCLGVSMFLQRDGGTDRALVMLPTSAMMLTSIWFSLYQEFLAVKSYDAYRPFI